MKLASLPLLALSLVFLVGAAAPVKMTPVKVTDGVYMLEHSQGSGNSTVVITNDGVVVFDFHIDNADQTLAFIRKTTDKQSNDPRYAAYKKAELGQPDIGFDGSMTLYLGGLTFVMTAEGRGHSTGDLTVYIPQKRVFLMGDLLDTEIHPGQGESAEVFYSNVQGWINILDNIMRRNLAVETYVPGHGPVHIGRGVKDLEEQRRYFVVMRDEVAKMVQAGKTLEQIEKEFKVPQEFAHYKRPERLRQFYKLFYHQLAETGY
jgi:glyoxylase-like metal-dependent hydrolase (beta-lactamase superfamily II)